MSQSAVAVHIWNRIYFQLYNGSTQRTSHNVSPFPWNLQKIIKIITLRHIKRKQHHLQFLEIQSQPQFSLWLTFNIHDECISITLYNITQQQIHLRDNYQMCWRKIFVFIFRLIVDRGRKEGCMEKYWYIRHLRYTAVHEHRTHTCSGCKLVLGLQCGTVDMVKWGQDTVHCTVYCTVLHCTGGPVTAHASYLCAGCLALPVLAGAVSRLGAVNTGHICAGRRSCWAAELGDWVICVSMRVVVARVRSHSSDQTVMHCCAMHRCVMHHSCRPLLHRTTLLQGDEELPNHITESSGEA